MMLSRGRAYSRIEALRKAAQAYCRNTNPTISMIFSMYITLSAWPLTETASG